MGLARNADAPAFSAVERTSGSSFPLKIATVGLFACNKLAKPRLNLQPVHLRHMNIDQGNRGAMSPGMPQELIGIAKCFCREIG